MRRKRQAEAMPQELQLAIGLVWGHLNAYQYEEAYDLALGCLQLWPEEPKLQLMCDFAAAEVMEPVDQQRLRALRTQENGEWVDLLLRRVRYQLEDRSASKPANAERVANAAKPAKPANVTNILNVRNAAARAPASPEQAAGKAVPAMKTITAAANAEST